MPNEIELKLRISTADVPRLRRHPALKQRLIGKPVTRKLTSIYYDTPDLRLLVIGISLRVRRMSCGWFQAVKAAGNALAGLHQRMEWEDILAKGEPDFSKIIDPDLAGIFADQSLREALKPVFITEVSRTEWQLEYEDGSRIEVALDLGKLKVNQQETEIHEVELELKQGQAHHLFDLALALLADIPLHIENISKAQRGYAYLRPTLIPDICVAKTINLNAKMPVQKASQLIVSECLRHLQGNQETVVHGTDPEGVHQMHIAVRRLRSALKIFKINSAFINSSINSSAFINIELSWLSALLGEVRDLDVFLHETLPAAYRALPAETTHAALQQSVTSAQLLVMENLKLALESQRYQRLLLTLGAWLAAEDSADEIAHSNKKIGKLAVRRLLKSFDRLKKDGEVLHTLNIRQLHKIRIKAKYLRYALEFFTPVLEEKHVLKDWHRLLQELTQLQKALGMRNDIDMAEKLLSRLMLNAEGKLQDETVQTIRLWNSLRIAKADKRVNKAWRAFVQTNPVIA